MPVARKQTPLPREGSPRRSARTVLVLVYTGWFAALAIGVLAYEGEPVTVKFGDLPLRHFDWLFRRAGALLLFAAWALRAGVKHALHARGDGGRENVWLPGAVYAVQATARAGIYELHRAGAIFSPQWWLGVDPSATDAAGHPPHVMSDHVLLASTLVGGLACEAALVYLSLAQRTRPLSPLLLKACAVVATSLALLVSAEVYYTARYFHPPGEILIGAALGLVAFQAPLLMLTARALRAAERKETAARTQRGNGGGGRRPVVQ